MWLRLWCGELVRVQTEGQEEGELGALTIRGISEESSQGVSATTTLPRSTQPHLTVSRNLGRTAEAEVMGMRKTWVLLKPARTLQPERSLDHTAHQANLNQSHPPSPPHVKAPTSLFRPLLWETWFIGFPVSLLSF